ncbi:MAG: (Fe-S)-binding protein [Candidatus Eisenbacteria bacterium]
MMTLDQLARRTKATLCLGCGKCTGMCPLAELSHGHSPRRLVARALADLEEDGRILIRQCLTCGACEQRCPEGVAFVDFVRHARAALPPEERASCPHHQILAQATRLQAEGGSRPDRLAWLTPDLKVKKEGEVMLFVGCLPLFDKVYADLDVKMVEIARSAVRILNRLGIEPVVREEEVCCGHDLLWAGDPASFRKLAERNVTLIESTGAMTIVTTCAECARTLSLSYKEVIPGFKPKVVHMAAFVAERGKELGLEAGEWNGGAKTVTYQDPCRLARHLEVLDEPREVLRSLPGVQLREMELSGLRSRCCGTAGFQHCDAESRLLQAMRLADARATGAGTLVTACPKCMIHFQCAQAEDERRASLGGTAPMRKRMQTEDLTVLIDGALMRSMAAAPAEGGE